MVSDHQFGPRRARAAASFLQIADVARQAYVTSGKNHVLNGDGAQQVLRISRGRLAPDAVDAIYQEALRFTHSKRTCIYSSPKFFDVEVKRGW